MPNLCGLCAQRLGRFRENSKPEVLLLGLVLEPLSCRAWVGQGLLLRMANFTDENVMLELPFAAGGCTIDENSQSGVATSGGSYMFTTIASPSNF